VDVAAVEGHGLVEVVRPGVWRSPGSRHCGEVLGTGLGHDPGKGVVQHDVERLVTTADRVSGAVGVLRVRDDPHGARDVLGVRQGEVLVHGGDPAGDGDGLDAEAHRGVDRRAGYPTTEEQQVGGHCIVVGQSRPECRGRQPDGAEQVGVVEEQLAYGGVGIV
jgi:hypothetical protein